MGYGSKSLTEWMEDSLRIATEHGFTDSTVGECFALMHTEISEGFEDYRNGEKTNTTWYEVPDFREVVTRKGPEKIKVINRVNFPYPTLENGSFDLARPYKPCGVPSEMADVIIRVLHFCGKEKIDIEQAVREKMNYNETRPYKHGKKL